MASPQLVAALLKDVSDGVRVLRERGVLLSDAQILERARNIVNGLICNYEIKPVPEAARLEWATPLIEGRPVGHGWSCRCDPCDLYRRSVNS